MPLYAGICETNITPPPGVWMCGYAFRPTGCAGVHDELFARALVLDNGDKRIAILAMDLIGLDFDLVERIRAGIYLQTGIAAEAVMLNATHTHGGPNVRGFNAMGARDEPYIDVLARKLIGAAAQAAGNLRPASLAYGRAPVQIGVNRREVRADGRCVIGVNPGGPVAPRADTLTVRDSRGQPAALLFSHACHPTMLGAENLLITADFPGFACEEVRKETDGRVMPFFLQGCCGDINPHPRGTFEDARALGKTLAGAALEAMESSEPLPNDVLEFRESSLALPLLPPRAADECDAAIAEWEAAMHREQEAGRPGHALHAEGMRDYWRMERACCEMDPDGLQKPFTVQLLSACEARFIGMPAEMFVEYQLNFQDNAHGPLFALGYTNGVHGYMPTAKDYPLGGYEVDGAHRYYGTLMFAPECERLICEAVEALLEGA